MSNVSDSFTYDVKTIRVFSIMFFLFTAVFGTMGNVSLCYVILKTKSLRTPLNSYIMNIAIADLLSCFVLMPLRIFVASDAAWDINVGIICGGEMFIRVTVDTARLFFLAYVSYERYLAIANPFNRDKRIPKLRAVISTCIIWILAIGLASLAVVQFSNITLMEACELRWRGHDRGLVEVYVIAPIFVLTVVLITLFYILIIRILMKHRSTMSRYLGGKSKNKVKPVDDTAAVSSTPQKPDNVVSITTIVPENSAAPSSTSNSEVPINVQSEVATLHLFPKIGPRDDEDKNGTQMEPLSVLQFENSVKMVDGKEGACVSKQQKTTNNHDGTGVSQSGSTFQKPEISVDANRHDSLASNALLTLSASAKAISEVQTTSEGNNIVLSSVDHKLPRVPNDDVADSKTMLVDDFSSSGEVLAGNSKHNEGKLAMDPAMKGNHHNAFETEQNVGQQETKCDIIQSPEQTFDISCQEHKTDLPNDKANTTVNENHLQQNKSDKGTLITDTKDLQKNTTVFTDDNEKLTVDKHLKENKLAMSKDEEKDIVNETPEEQNSVTSTDDKAKVIVYNVETVPSENKTQVKTCVHQNKSALSENGQIAAQSIPEISVENGDDSVSNKYLHNKTSSEKEAHVELVTSVKGESRSKSPGIKIKRSKQKGVRKVNVVGMDGTVHRESVTNASGAVCKRDDDNKIRGRRKVELKAAKRIIAVIGTFFSLWIPFPFSVFLSSRVAVSEAEHVMWLHVMLLMSSVSAMTSALMPVLNGVSNKQIKSAGLRIYRKLIGAHCKKRA